MPSKHKGKKKPKSLDALSVPVSTPAVSPSKHRGKKKSESSDSSPVSLSVSSPAALAPTGTHRKKSDQLMMRFYEPLVLQHVLDPIRGSHIQCEPLPSLDESEQDNCNLRRSFLKNLAYMCDFERGGATVTAIALETRSEGMVFWVAANENVKDKVVSFLERILRGLAGITGETSAVEESIFRSAVEFGLPRVKFYWRFMQDPLNKCLKIFDLEREKSEGMTAWLSSFKDYEEDMLHLCQFSYDARSSPYMKELTRRSEKGSGPVSVQESNASNFLKLRHYIGRLGSHMKAARTLVAAAMRFPTFFDNFEIQRVPSPKPAEKSPPMDDLTTLDGIARRMLPSGDENLPLYQKALQDMDSNFQIYQRLVDEYNKSTFLPRVHAELILLEHFYAHRDQCAFVEGDKYIGCSKPACYCCYHYIRAHPGNFVRPPSHNKIYLNWRPPDVVDDDDGSVAMHRRDIVNHMLKEIRRDVLDQIWDQRPRGRTRPDSTTGITVTAL